MQIAINIDDNLYTRLFDNGDFDAVDMLNACVAIRKGIPLPKGHGDLIDRNKIEYLKSIHDAKYGYITWSDAIARIKYSAPTIIEADEAVIPADREVRYKE